LAKNNLVNVLNSLSDEDIDDKKKPTKLPIANDGDDASLQDQTYDKMTIEPSDLDMQLENICIVELTDDSVALSSKPVEYKYSQRSMPTNISFGRGAEVMFRREDRHSVRGGKSKSRGGGNTGRGRGGGGAPAELESKLTENAGDVLANQADEMNDIGGGKKTRKDRRKDKKGREKEKENDQQSSTTMP
jgi:hypothetical protein